MSLGIVFKAPDGVVLAADSRATLFRPLPVPAGGQMMLPAHFNNATKLLQFAKQPHLGAVTFGAAVIGQTHPRSARSYLPEFEATLPEEELTVTAFAERLGQFYLGQWKAANMPAQAEPMVFGVAGYDPGALHGTVSEVAVPAAPAPRQVIPDAVYGAWWGGQRLYVDRLVNGFDDRALGTVFDYFGAPAEGRDLQALSEHLKQTLQAPIPWQFLSLQDCVSLSAFLIRTTIGIQSWTVDVRGVGGAVDVATITPAKGFTAIKVKEVYLEQSVAE